MTQATYNAILANVYSLTARPDLGAETALAIRKATMKAHLKDFWADDLTQTLVTLPVLSPVGDVSFRYTIDLTDIGLFPLLRKVAYVKEYNSPLTGQEIQFKQLDPDNLLDNYLLEEINYWTQISRQATLRCNKTLAQVAVGFYRYPNVDITVYDSWIAAQFPDIIVEEATAKVLATIGKDSEAARYANNFEDNIHAVTMAQASAV